MRRSAAADIVLLILVGLTFLTHDFRRARAEAPRPTTDPPLAVAAVSALAPVSGTLQVAGLKNEVRVTRDRWGVPHIVAGNSDDLFLAQGFVQAQDRLFQMDLWRRSTQGRLSEVLGPEFLERDRLKPAQNRRAPAGFCKLLL